MLYKYYILDFVGTMRANSYKSKFFSYMLTSFFLIEKSVW